MKNTKTVYSGVYAIIITKEDTNYMYIGSSMDIRHRMTNNLGKLRRNEHHCTVLQELYNQGYSVKAEIIELINESKDIINTEFEYIEHFKRIDGIEVLNKLKPICCKPKVYLTVDQVKNIKQLLANGEKSSQIAEKLKVKVGQVYLIKSGFRWKSVKNQQIVDE